MFCVQALSVIDYLISNGSERAVDEIIEHTYQISVSLFLFLYIYKSFSCGGTLWFSTDMVFVCHFVIDVVTHEF